MWKHLLLVTLIVLEGLCSIQIQRSHESTHHKINKRRAHGPGFTRESIFPDRDHQVTQYSGDTEDGPSRAAVEHVPITAGFKSTLLDEDDDSVTFNRGDVEAYPFEYDDVELQGDKDVLVIKSTLFEDEESTYGRVGTRGDVESPPNFEFNFNNVAHFEDYYLQQHMTYSAPDLSPYGALKYSNPIDSVAGSDLLTYRGDIRQTNSDYKVVCFHSAWSVYREMPFDFSTDDIDAFSCTHLIYAFARLDKEQLTLTPADAELDVVKGGYKSTIRLREKNPKLKVLIGVGGYAEGGNTFSRMSATSEGRTKFIKSTLKFLDEHKFDGVLIDWEFPGASDRGGRSEDKENFATLVEELNTAFQPSGYILAATASPAIFRVQQGYDIPRLSNNLDFISVTTYDLRGDWDGRADHHAPLRSRSTDLPVYKNLNVEDGIQYLISQGADREKLLVGVPFYGRSYTLQDPTNIAPGARARTVGMEGRHTKEHGFMSYYEVCTEQRNGGWVIDRDEIGGPFMSKGDQWISYDDPEYIHSKMQWLKREGLGGAMVWAIDLDDYLGLCGTRWPLLSTIRRSLLSQYSTKTGFDLERPPQEFEYNFSEIDVPCIEGEYTPDQDDCASYVVCVHGNFVRFSCKEPLLWNPKKNMCDWHTNVDCKISAGVGPPIADEFGSTSTTTSSTTSSTTMSTPSSSVVVQPVSTSGELSGDFKVVCYFTNWAWYRPGIGKYKPEDIDPSLCTHIVYGFAVLDYSNLIIKPHDSWADIDNKFYEKVTELKKMGKKVTIAIGGWNDSAGDKYSRLVNNPAARMKFIEHVIEFIKKHNFDGLDLDWEYPVCWQVNCQKGPKSDKFAFSAWVKELSIAFRPHGLLLSAAVSPSKKVIDEGYDVPVLSQYMDWIAVMTYDFHGQWDKKTGHVAPIYTHPEDDYDYFNMDYAIRYWIKKGATADKLVLGMPLYGQSFTLNNPSVHGLNAPARTGGSAGQFTRAKGFLAYYEICHAIQNGWSVVKDPEGRMGPYAYSGNQWVSFDDVDAIRFKSEYIRNMRLGGGMVWALDLDDFSNRCGQGPYPLMNTIKSVLGPPKSGSLINDGVDSVVGSKPVAVEPEPGQHDLVPTPVTMPEPEPTSQSPSSTSSSSGSASDGYKVVCYFTNWAWYRQGEGKYKPEDIDHTLCTHIVYGFAVLDHSNLVIKPHDRWADYDNEFYRKVTDLRSKGVKVLIAIGGWNDSAGGKYSKLVNNAHARAKFTEHVIQFIINNNFDGLDLDWEYPVCWQVNCNKGPASDKSAFGDWVKELKMAFEPHGLLLSAAVSPSNKVIDKGYDVPILNRYLDWIAVMTYDYHGQWDKKTGHVSPMYGHPEDDNPAFNTNFTIHYWLEKGADRKKLVMGLPMYGQSFTLSQSSNNGLNQKSYGGGEAGPYTRARGFLAYYEICYAIKNKNWNVVYDNFKSMGPYAHKGNQWVGFDDISTIRKKSNWIKEMGLGGAMIWALDLDDFRNRCGCERYPLLRTINRVLRDYPIPDPKCPSFVSNNRETNPIQGHSPGANPSSHSTAKKCQEGEYKKHNNCKKFHQCVFGEFLERSCAPGLHWNGKDRCDYPAAAKCENQPISSVSDQTSVSVSGSQSSHDPSSATTTTMKTTTTKMTTTIRPPPVVAGSSDYKVVCYFTNWAWYRQGAGKYKPEDIDPNLCSHIVYGFAVLDSQRLLIKPHDTWADYDNKFYAKVTALKKFGIKVLIAIGGWNDSLGSKYSKLVNDPAARARFIKHVVEFIQKHNFDGLDLDWEYPKCWQVDCNKGPASDKQAFSAWIRELHAAFQPHGLLLSAAVSPSFKVIDAGYEVKALDRYLDWIAVMTYDYHGHWDKKTGHVAPMYQHPEDDVPEFNANYTIHYWLQHGASRKKLIMGMPLYGQAFSLAEAENNGLNQKARKGQAGEYTRAAGFLAYYEICDRIKNKGYTVVKDPEGTMGPYAYKGNQWVGYDDVETIRYKSNWIKKMGLGGGMIWALDLDDFRNRCGCENHPLLRTINRVLRGYSVTDPGCN